LNCEVVAGTAGILLARSSLIFGPGATVNGNVYAEVDGSALNTDSRNPSVKDTVMQSKVTTDGTDRLGVVEIYQRFPEQQWPPAH